MCPRRARRASDARDTDLEWLRRLIAALAADDDLFDLMVLKGDNALSLVHRVGLRASVDLDYSLESDPPDPQALFAALRARLEPHGYVLFDDQLTKRGSGRRPRWGGYTAEFKLITRERFDALGGDVERIRRGI